VRGYNHLLREGFPLPSYRTLCERVEKAQFEPGIHQDVLEWLRVKLENMENRESRDCVIALDEMQIHPTVEFDRGN
jgi:Transposase protein